MSAREADSIEGQRIPPTIPYARQHIDEDDIAAVVSALRGDWLTQGPTVARFEEALAERCSAPYCVAVSSGTAALHLACIAAGVSEGGAGITADITFVASANGVRYAGGDVAFADIDASTGLVRADSMVRAAERLLERERRPQVFIPVDFSGSVADLPAVRAAASRYGASVIEDAAHALGATYESEGQTYSSGSCAHSDFAILSFHPVKHITTLEGGAVLARDEGAYRELLELRSHGVTRDPRRLARYDGPWYYEQRRLGFHYRISDVQCALGLNQLTKLDRLIARRRALAEHYDEALRARGLMAWLDPIRGSRSVHHLYVLSLRSLPGEPLAAIAARRLRLYNQLRERGILTQVHYIPLHRQPDLASSGETEQLFPDATRYYAGCLSIPLFPSMSDSDVVRVVDALSEIVPSLSAPVERPHLRG